MARKTNAATAHAPEAAPAAAPGLSLDEILAKAESGTAKKKTPGTLDATPFLQVGEGETTESVIAATAQAISEFLAQHRREAEAKAAKEKARVKVLERALPARLAAMVQKGFLSSVHLFGTPDESGNRPSATITWAKGYSALPASDTALIDKVKGWVGENFDRWFEKKLKLVVKPEALENEAVVRELIEKLGPERFVAIFDAQQTLEATNAYHEEHLRVLPEATRTYLDLLVKPKAASVTAS